MRLLPPARKNPWELGGFKEFMEKMHIFCHLHVFLLLINSPCKMFKAKTIETKKGKEMKKLWKKNKKVKSKLQSTRKFFTIIMIFSIWTEQKIHFFGDYEIYVLNKKVSNCISLKLYKFRLKICVSLWSTNLSQNKEKNANEKSFSKSFSIIGFRRVSNFGR